MLTDNDLVYRGQPHLLHIPDGNRSQVGQLLATRLDQIVRAAAENRTAQEREEQSLCPGCYMVVGFNMLVALASRNGQSLSELGRSMKVAFEQLELEPTPTMIEQIVVMLDPCDADVDDG